ncbi:hypothetical protein HKD37_14G039765 [Glycine soja]
MSCALVTCWSWVRIRKQPLCICKGKAAYNIPPPYLRIAKSLWAMGYKVKNYLKWSHVQTFLKGDKLNHLIGKDVPKPTKKNFGTWDEVDALVMSWLWNSME